METYQFAKGSEHGSSRAEAGGGGAPTRLVGGGLGIADAGVGVLDLGVWKDELVLLARASVSGLRRDNGRNWETRTNASFEDMQMQCG
ncbi:hypothetical protein TRIUR3_27204 [Triticum urartu]|uniref:Uncharacterized protein n=1 Tax=Triticum urartu TaxID=4572 RepID=M7YV21_TRIUA|nr:hypothetical protein TRIUR3_27204 [Triticum urartu]